MACIHDISADPKVSVERNRDIFRSAYALAVLSRSEATRALIIGSDVTFEPPGGLFGVETNYRLYANNVVINQALKTKYVDPDVVRAELDREEGQRVEAILGIASDCDLALPTNSDGLLTGSLARPELSLAEVSLANPHAVRDRIGIYLARLLLVERNNLEDVLPS